MENKSFKETVQDMDLSNIYSKDLIAIVKDTFDGKYTDLETLIEYDKNTAFFVKNRQEGDSLDWVLMTAILVKAAIRFLQKDIPMTKQALNDVVVLSIIDLYPQMFDISETLLEKLNNKDYDRKNSDINE